GPRGSAVTLGQPGDASGGPERFGGLEGGEGRRGGTVGSTARGMLRNSPGDPDSSGLPPPIGASGTLVGEGVPRRQGPGRPRGPDWSRLPPPSGASGTVVGEGVPGLQGPSILGGRIGRAAVPDTRPGQGRGPGVGDADRRLALERQRVEPPESDPLTLAHRPR